MRWLSLLSLAVLLVPVVSCQESAPPETVGDEPSVAEIARAAPRHARVLLENDYVLAAEFTLPPGGEIPPHYGRNRAVFALGDYRLEFVQEGRRTIAASAAGDIAWHPAGSHSVRNVGDAEARFLVVFRKLSRLFEYSFTDAAGDIACLAPDKSEVLLENEFMRVARFDLSPGDELPRHGGLNRLMYALTPYALRYTADGPAQAQTCTTGAVHYYTAENHAVINVGDTPARYLMFELRQ